MGVLTPFVNALWRRQSQVGKEPKPIAKMAIGCALLSTGYGTLFLAEILPPKDGKVSTVWVSFRAPSPLSNRRGPSDDADLPCHTTNCQWRQHRCDNPKGRALPGDLHAWRALPQSRRPELRLRGGPALHDL